MPIEPDSIPLFAGGPPQADQVFLQNMGASQSFVDQMRWDEAAQTSTTNWLERTLQQSGIGSDQDSPLMSADVARAKLHSEGVQFDIPDSGIREATYQSMVARQHDKQAHADAIDRGPQGFVAGARGFAVSLARQAIDPLNLASAFIPFVGEARMAEMLGAAGVNTFARAGVYARVGAIEGTFGNLALEPAMHYFAGQLQEDYTMADSLLNTAFGGIIGGGLHLGIGTIKDWRAGVGLHPDAVPPVHEIPARGEIPEKIAAIPFESRVELGRMALAQAIDGRDIDVAAALDLADITQKATDQERQPGFLKTAEDLLAQRQQERLQATPGFLQSGLDKLALREIDTQLSDVRARIDERVQGESAQQVSQIHEAQAAELTRQIQGQTPDVTAKNLSDLIQGQQTRAELLTDATRMKAAVKERDLTVKELRKKVQRMQETGERDLATYRRAGMPVDQARQIDVQRRAVEGVHQAAKNGQAPDAGIPREALQAIDEAEQIVKDQTPPDSQKASVEAQREMQDAMSELEGLLKVKDSPVEAKTLFAQEDAAITQATDDTKIMNELAQCRLRNE